MTEAEWLACGDPEPMLALVLASMSDRKRRLFAAARARLVWHLLQDERSREAVEIAERHADGVASDEALAVAHRGADRAQYEIWSRRDEPREPWRASLWPLWATGGTRERLPEPHPLVELGIPLMAQAAILRDLVRYPAGGAGSAPLGTEEKRLARHAYEARDGTALPILADALEEAGCADAALLAHLRAPGPHARGCWALDLVLGNG